MTKNKIIDRLDEIKEMEMDTVKEAIEDLINDVDIARYDLEERESSKTNSKIQKAIEVLENALENTSDIQEAVEEALTILTD